MDLFLFCVNHNTNQIDYSVCEITGQLGVIKTGHC